MHRAQRIVGHMGHQADLGLIGLAVMGSNLALNFESKGFKVAVASFKQEEVEAFTNGPAQGKRVVPCHSVAALKGTLAKPRKVMMMVRAGDITDYWISELLTVLEKGDIIIDGGNSNFRDTERRVATCAAKGLLFVGAGVSGGEEGALNGPSIMPGGNPEAWPLIKNMLQTISAKTSDGVPCCQWVGSGGAGHYVKMVHNGIEYGDIQLINEAYFLMTRVLGMTNDEAAAVFEGWNQGDLDCYLIEITGAILRKREHGQHVVDLILDTAGQKGTGKWTAISALELGLPLTLIGEAVYARCLSAQKEERVQAAQVLAGPQAPPYRGDPQQALRSIRDALYASKMVSYAQGFMLIKKASDEYKWAIDLGSCALLWRGGCIIRSGFLADIKQAFESKPSLPNLLMDGFFTKKVAACQDGWRETCKMSITHGVPCPAILSALAYYDGYRTARLPANLLQAQRDYFGAHTYERVDKPRGQFFHTDWTGRGGSTASSAYNA